MSLYPILFILVINSVVHVKAVEVKSSGHSDLCTVYYPIKTELRTIYKMNSF